MFWLEGKSLIDGWRIFISCGTKKKKDRLQKNISMRKLNLKWLMVYKSG
jgi:hypothetical protein